MRKNIKPLYLFEMHKITHSRLTQITLFLLCVVVVLMGLMPSKDLGIREAMRELNGRPIDNELIDEMNDQVQDIYETDWDNKENGKFFGLYYTVWSVNSKETAISADEFYDERLKQQQEGMIEDGLTNNEIAWWNKQESKISKPFTYVSWLNAKNLADYMFNICLFGLLAAALCLSGSFAGEHRRNTDQILLSSKNGRKETYVAKILAGVSFMLIYAVFFSGLLAVTLFLRTGLDGLDAVVQLEMPFSAYPLNFMQFIGIQFVLIVVSSVLFSMISMVFSELFRNGVAVMGLMISSYLLSLMVIVPTKYKIPSMIKSMLPTDLVSLMSLNDHRLINVFGHLHTMFAVAPIVYLLITMVLFFIGGSVYCKYQVTGR